MRTEIGAAVQVFAKLLVSQPARSSPFLKPFCLNLMRLMHEKFEGHWYPHDSSRGQAFRAIRHVQGRPDALVVEAIGNVELLAHTLPPNFTIWCDPGYVAFRIGESGSICELTLDDVYEPATTPTAAVAPMSTPSSFKLMPTFMMSSASPARVSPPPELMLASDRETPCTG